MGSRKPSTSFNKLKSVKMPDMKFASHKRPHPGSSLPAAYSINATNSLENRSASAKFRPHTPDVHSEPLTSTTSPLGVEIKKTVQTAIFVFSKNLYKLNCRVEVNESMRHAGVVLLEEAVRAQPTLLSTLAATPAALLAFSAAALWVSFKFLGVRVTSPNGSLMSQSSQVPLKALKNGEIDILEALDWEVAAVLRRRGVPIA